MMSQGSRQKKPMIMVRIIKAPIKAISKFLDLYSKSFTKFTNSSNRPVKIVKTTTNSQQLPRSFSISRVSYFDEPPESPLVRSISRGSSGSSSPQDNIADREMYRNNQLQSYALMKGVLRSSSVGMSKIDEDRASSFRDDNILLRNKLIINDKDSIFSRSRSYDRVSTELNRSVNVVYDFH